MAKTTESIMSEKPIETPVAPKNQLYHIRVNRPHGSKEDSLYIGKNGKGYQIKYDTDVYAPESVCYEIMQKLRAERVRDFKIDQL